MDEFFEDECALCWGDWDIPEIDDIWGDMHVQIDRQSPQIESILDEYYIE